MSDKPLLMERRARLIDQLNELNGDPGLPQERRVAIQAELTVVNAELKRLNVTQAAALRYAADTRKVRGQAEQQANTDRALAKLPSSPLPPAHPKRAAPFLTRGEFLLKNARQMLRTIEAFKAERKLAHTAAFEQPLRDFIEAQSAHVAERKAQREAQVVAEPDQWKETWSNAE